MLCYRYLLVSCEKPISHNSANCNYKFTNLNVTDSKQNATIVDLRATVKC